MTESWLDQSILDSEIDVPGYVIERKNPNRHGGGVIMYIRDSITYTRRVDISETSQLVENIWIEVKSLKSSINVKSLLLGCFYRPPSSNSDYFDGILDIIEKASLDDKEFVVHGDFNYDYQFDESLCPNPLNYIENLYSMS